jgi:thiol-disulfide isomerase/thioredoxin
MTRWLVAAALAAAVATGCSGSRSAPPGDPPAADKPPATDKPQPGEVLAALAGDALIGRRAPGGTIDLLDKGRVALTDLEGRKPIYLKFWATWCIPCRKQMPHLEAAHRKYGDRIAVFAVDLGVNDSIDAVRALQAENQLTVPIAIDGDGSLAEAFHIAVTPQHVLIDRAGIVRYVGNEAGPALDHALETLLADASVGPARPGERSVDSPPGGEPAAPLVLTLRDGTPFTLAAHVGAPIALSFVAEWCDGYIASSRPVMAQACAAHTRQIAALHASHPGLVWVTIAHPVWTTPTDLDELCQRFALTTPIGIDHGTRWFHRFGVRDVATTVLLDSQGVEQARVTGAGDDLAAALARLR